MENGLEFEPVNLSNVAEGKLEEQFQDAVTEVHTFLQESKELGRFEVGKDGIIRCRVALEVLFEFDCESRTLDIGGRVAKVEPPKRRAIYRNGVLRSGVMLVEKAVQGDLIPPKNVRSIKDKGE